MKHFMLAIALGTSLLAFSGCCKSGSSTSTVVEPHELKKTEGVKMSKDAPELTDSKWTMVELMGEAVSSPDKAKPYTLWLQAEGMVSAFGGCNQIAGSYSLAEDNSIKFGQLAMTKMMCPDIKNEDTFAKMLSQVDGYQVSGDSLVLLQGDKPMAGFVARPIDMD